MRDTLGEWTLKPLVQALQAMRGVQLIASMTLVAELQDSLRFKPPFFLHPVHHAGSAVYLAKPPPASERPRSQCESLRAQPLPKTRSQSICAAGPWASK